MVVAMVMVLCHVVNHAPKGARHGRANIARKCVRGLGAPTRSWTHWCPVKRGPDARINRRARDARIGRRPRDALTDRYCCACAAFLAALALSYRRVCETSAPKRCEQVSQSTVNLRRARMLQRAHVALPRQRSGPRALLPPYDIYQQSRRR